MLIMQVAFDNLMSNAYYASGFLNCYPNKVYVMN
jgi:hypothetical protein